MLKNIKRTAVLLAIVLATAATAVFADGDVLLSGEKPANRFSTNIKSLNIDLENNTDETKNLTVITVTYSTTGICKSVEIAEAVPVEAQGKKTFTVGVNYAHVNEVVKVIAAEEENGILFPVNSQMLECSKANFMKLVN